MTKSQKTKKVLSVIAFVFTVILTVFALICTYMAIASALSMGDIAADSNTDPIAMGLGAVLISFAALITSVGACIFSAPAAAVSFFLIRSEKRSMKLSAIVFSVINSIIFVCSAVILICSAI